jgi:hypothetical protein
MDFVYQSQAETHQKQVTDTRTQRRKSRRYSNHQKHTAIGRKDQPTSALNLLASVDDTMRITSRSGSRDTLQHAENES